MSGEIWRWVIGVAILAHGIGHVLFMPLLAGAMKLDASGHSWLLTGLLGDGLTKGLATLFAAIALAAFLGAGAGFIGQAAWWRPAALVGAVVSLVVVVAMWDGLPTSSALFALVFDVAVLAALVLVPARDGALA